IRIYLLILCRDIAPERRRRPVITIFVLETLFIIDKETALGGSITSSNAVKERESTTVLIFTAHLNVTVGGGGGGG
ncbi:hypothetical protein ACJX0J_012060, partial [Zea mays]